MKYIKKYEEYGLKSDLVKIGLAGSLLLNLPDIKPQMINPYDASNPKNFTNVLSPYNQLYKPQNYSYPDSKNNYSDKESEYKKMDSTQLKKELEKWVRQMKFQAEIAEISSKAQRVDDSLTSILSKIDSAAKSGGDTAKFNELFIELTSHMKDKYGYEIPKQNIEELNDETILNLSDGMSKRDMFALMGWIGSILLASCGIPQAWTSYKDKHSNGLSWSFLLLWAVGELFAMLYVYDKLDLPMMMNYGTNILILAIMIYYKIRGSR